MNIINKNTHRLTRTLIIISTLILTACGGGSGGGSSDNAGSTGISYTGNTKPADVDSTNNQSFSAAILDGSQDSQQNLNQLGILVIATDETPAQLNKQYAMMGMLVSRIKSDIENTATNNESIVNGVTSSITGNCGGTSTISSTSSSGSIYSMTYNKFCTSFNGLSMTISGSLIVSSVVDVTNKTLTSMSISFSRFSMTFVDANNDNSTYTNEFSGIVTASFSSDGTLNDMTVSVNFIENGMVYQLTDMSYITSGSDISISGKIFHPNYGYVTFSTTEPFTLFNNQLCGGTLSVTGVSSNFTITADTTCATYTYSGTDKNNTIFSGTYTIL